MHALISRAGRWPAALSLFGLIALGSCSDEPVAPKLPTEANALYGAPTGNFVDVAVTNTSGDQVVGSIRWAADQIHSAGGAIHFDPSLDGATIILNAPLSPNGPVNVVGPPKASRSRATTNTRSSVVRWTTGRSA